MSSVLSPGTTVERYRIEQVVGSGSMGEVFRGVDIELKRKVAIKILSERHRDNAELRQRFTREGRAVAAISHPNVVQVFTTGTFDGRPYIAMEFLDGSDLGTSVERKGAWPPLAAAMAIRDAALGLRAAARAGLIHRDVKPANLVILQDGIVKVTDFGLAKPIDPGDDPVLTNAGMVVGTPDYIAPEQARGETIDERVDLYALGGTLYYLLTGVPPFRTGVPAEDNYMKVVGRHLRKPPPNACDRNPDTDIELARLAQAMMAKNPAQRPDYSQVIAGLGAIIARLEASGAAKLSPALLQGRGTGGTTAPTPFVGGTSARALTAGDDTTAPVNLAPGDPLIVKPGLPRWLLVPSIFACLLFLIGLFLRLAGPMPAGSPDRAEPDAGPPAQAALPALPTMDAAPVMPDVPEGMMRVHRADGSRWLLVDTRPVTYDAYAALFPAHKKPRKRAGTEPVISVSYEYAAAFARAQGKRLITAEEWDQASRTPGFVPAGGLWEWVAGEPADKRAPVRSERGAATRDVSGTSDTTFRLGTSL